MPAKVSKRLVIDASVARSAGGENADYPTSKFCRDFLKAVLNVCHHIVMEPQVSAEWKRHRSNFAANWLTSMVARKKVEYLDDVSDSSLRGKIERSAANKRDAEAMQKDYCLIEAAITTDRTVISLDNTARALFVVAACHVGELRSIVWVNPERVEEEPILWLENGARSERKRWLKAPD